MRAVLTKLNEFQQREDWALRLHVLQASESFYGVTDEGTLSVIGQWPARLRRSLSQGLAADAVEKIKRKVKCERES